MNAIPNPFAPTPPPTLPTVPEKGPGGWGNDTASVVDALLEPVFAEYPLVDEQVKDLISRSFEEFMGASKEMRSEKKDQMVIRKLKSRYPEKMASKYANMVQNSFCPSSSCACRKLSSRNSSLLESRSSQFLSIIERTSRGGGFKQELVNVGGKNTPQLSIWR